MNKYIFYYIAILLIIVISCAVPGSPKGGIKDTEPPVILEEDPKNMSTNFKKGEITIYFDEYIKLQDVKKNIIISPPLKETPEIKPQGLPRTNINIQFNEKLRTNTTYTLNFGESIVDNNEGNKFPNYKYIFSTGKYIDSLSIHGKIKFCDSKEMAKNSLIMLYELDTLYTDSIVYKDKPTYFMNTLDTNAFKITHIKSGKFKLVALNGNNVKFKYIPKNNKIAFYQDTIVLPRDTSKFFSLNLFKEIPKFRIKSPVHKGKGHIILNFEGQNKNLSAKRILPKKHKNTQDLFINSVTGDTINYWFQKGKEDSIVFAILDKQKHIDSITVKLKKQKKLEFKVELPQNTIKPNEYIDVQTNAPIIKVDTHFIQILNKDSIKVKYTTKIDKYKQNLQLIFKNNPQEKYKIQLLPKAITNILKQTNDTIKKEINTLKTKAYGLLELKLKNVKSFPIIIQLIQGKKVITEKYATKNKPFVFKHLDAGKYSFKIIFDKNGNRKWDIGNFLKGIQPEEIKYFKGDIDIKANWDIEQFWEFK